MRKTNAPYFVARRELSAVMTDARVNAIGRTRTDRKIKASEPDAATKLGRAVAEIQPVII